MSEGLNYRKTSQLTSRAPGVSFVKDWATKVQDDVPVPRRNAVFYTDQGDRNQMQGIIDGQLGGNGFHYFNIFDMQADGSAGDTKGLMPDKPSRSVRFMGIYRGSRGE